MGNLKIPKDMLEGQEGKIEVWKHIMQSMTKEELEDPELIDGARVERIAKGSGASTGAVRELLKQYKMSRKMIKGMKSTGQRAGHRKDDEEDERQDAERLWDVGMDYLIRKAEQEDIERIIEIAQSRLVSSASQETTGLIDYPIPSAEKYSKRISQGLFYVAYDTSWGYVAGFMDAYRG